MSALPEEERFRRECEVRHWFNQYFAKAKEPSLKNFLSWAARKNIDYQQCAATQIATAINWWGDVAEGLRALPDIYRDAIEPIVKSEWEKRHG